MSNVTLSIGGRSFLVACADGEEAHVSKLGQLIDDKVAAAGMAGQTETRMLLYASLLLADEVHELQTDSGPALPADVKDRLGRIAERIENLADLLEGRPVNA
ncbi:cell division protein ZapA [Novosphingobium malaysiense]|uniref:Cell division protein ZapA n=1 Tax=Novosphingobium malaysiense TaxID=1348853 RepID=A0A0B1ZLB9_9SPHN|nr:cell division protein ZapA [Novosphingobium malaysiense]KHK91366.1 cell division protein ZapA [Novosphingobium malaysiense]